MKKIMLCLLLAFGFFAAANAQIVNIPDANFKSVLVNSQCADLDGDGSIDGRVDTNNNGQIEISEAQAVISLYLNNSSIVDITGIQSFTNLQKLDCTYNHLTSVNLQGLTSLHTLNCSENQIANLNIQGLIILQKVICHNNRLTSLNAQGLTNLQELDCHTNQLSSLSLQGSISLQKITCYYNQLTSFNVQGLINLQELNCYSNQIPNLNVQGLQNLQNLNCSSNLLPSLNVQGLSNLQNLDCSSNLLPSLNVQGLSNLQILSCGYNQLPNLEVHGLINLQELNCAENLLTSINLQGLTNLHVLNVDFNQISNLDVEELINLYGLYCRRNRLSSLNLQTLTNLSALYCEWNQILSLNVQPLRALYSLDCSHNQLTSLNVQGLPLHTLRCTDNQLTSLNVQRMNVYELHCSNNYITDLKMDYMYMLYTLNACNNPISCVSYLPESLRAIYVWDTYITCYPNYLPYLQFNLLPLCPFNNPNGCPPTAYIYGNAFKDVNNNCVIDSIDILQQNIFIEAKDIVTQTVFTTNSKIDGSYELHLPSPATYEVKAVIQNNNYWQSCSAQMIVLPTDTSQIQRDVQIKPVVQCADVEVTHQLQNIARPCSTAVYKVSAYNAGTITATGVMATITLPTELSFTTASRPFTNMGNGVYRVMLPTINALARDTFSFSAMVSCTAQMNQMLCTEVEILPNTYCTSGGIAGWDGSDVAVFGRCIGSDSVRFVIQNIGTGNMTTSRNYGVIEDIVMVRGNAFQLAAGASDSITIAADPHKIYRIIAEESTNNPGGNTQESFMIWGCSGASNQIHWGFVNQFGLNNGSSNPHQLCSEVRTSFDPNDISAVAAGVGPQHFILNDTDLEYTIRFQNTGNDTAFVVRLVNPLPPSLNPASLRIGGSSHPFTWRLASNGVLEFLFQNIRLVDSTTNEPKSHGFVTYRIKTQPNLAIGTTIPNQANIYFDVNLPVATNTYTHTIGERISSIFLNTPAVIDNQYQVKIFPNPIQNEATLQIVNTENEPNMELNSKPFVFNLYNPFGQLLQTRVFTQSTLKISSENLPQGIYFYTIQKENSIVTRGKVEVMK
jgi:uncharacterized repeat protein (TIGR01451 family)